jgi:hypothetical protein
MKFTVQRTILILDEETDPQIEVVSEVNSQGRRVSRVEIRKLGAGVPGFMTEGQFIWDEPPVVRPRRRN